MNDPDIAGHLRTIRVWSSDSFPMVSRSAGFHLKICHSRGLQLRCASRNCWAVGRYSLRGLDRISQRLELQELPSCKEEWDDKISSHSTVIHVIFCFKLFKFILFPAFSICFLQPIGASNLSNQGIPLWSTRPSYPVSRCFKEKDVQRRYAKDLCKAPNV